MKFTAQLGDNGMITSIPETVDFTPASNSANVGILRWTFFGACATVNIAMYHTQDQQK